MKKKINSSIFDIGNEFTMNGEVKAKHSNQYFQKHKIRWTMIGFAVVFGILIWMTPIGRVMAMGVERVFIYIDEYASPAEISSEKPLIKDLKIRTKKVKDLKDYETVIKHRQDLYTGNLILVNGNHACKILEGNNLEKVSRLKNRSYKLVDEEMVLNEEMLIQINSMMKAFEKSTGKHDMILTSGYRTIEDQKKILQEKINLLGKEEAFKWAMLPRYSEHHTGYAVDMSIYTDQGNYIRYKGQDEYGWINQNSYKYGIIRRYDQSKESITGVAHEEWHYRYIGIPHAYIVVAKNFCLEEYIDYLKQYTFDTKHLIVECKQGRYEIYFVPSKGMETEVYVPSGKQYNISGNNVDGYIVTIEQ